jgi:succinate dehydrogenase flavin-adding protein (antitoxin of CptAB toxin-antitoxin module)
MTEYELLSFFEPKKYHSCVILGYSFDPVFFDEIVFPTLKRAGVVNNIVLVDYKMLEQSLIRLEENGFKRSEGYSICGIKSEGAFHPKIIQLYGEKKGLVHIGSGNPTYGGYSRNQEVWISFFVDSEEKLYGGIYRDVWKYIKGVSYDIGGIAAKKLSWIEQYSKWMSELPDNNNRFTELSDEEGAALLTSKEGIYKRLLELIDNDLISTINIHSPFFDNEISIVKALLKDIEPSSINIGLQPQHVEINPENITKLPDVVHFFDINGLLKKQGNETPRYVHAKLLELQGRKYSYLLLGSANLSFAAMGGKNASSKNEEISLLLRRKGSESYFESLGLVFSKEDKIDAKELSSILAERNSKRNYDNATLAETKHHITSIDELRDRYEIYSSSPIGKNISLGAQDNEMNLELYPVTDGNGGNVSYAIKPARSFLGGKIGYLCDNKGTPISNRVIIQNVQHLAKSNPSQRYKNIQVALSSIELEHDQLWELFSLIEPEDYVANEMPEVKRTVQKQTEKKSSSEKKGGEKLSYDEFTEREDACIKDIGIDYIVGRSTLAELIDVMNRIISSFAEREEDKLADEEEEADIEKSSGETEHDDEDKKEPILSTNAIRTYRKKAINYFRKYEKLLSQRLVRKNPLPHQFFAIHAISTYLLVYFTLKKFRVGDSELVRSSYLDADVIKYDNAAHSELKISALNTLLILTLIAALDLPEGSYYRFAPNAVRLEFLNVLDITSKNSVSIEYDEVVKYIENFIRITGFEEIDSSVVIKTFKRCWQEAIRAEVTDDLLQPGELVDGMICYSEIKGFISINTVSPINPKTRRINLCVPGFGWDDEKEDYISKGFHLPPAKLYKVSLADNIH